MQLDHKVLLIKNFIMNHYIRLAIFNEHVKIKLLAVAYIRFASVIIMLQRFKTLRRGLQDLEPRDRWAI